MSNLLLDPSLNSPPVSLPYDLEACTELMRGGSKSFFAASRLLPVRLRPPAIALYAFCRLADDAIDEGDDPILAMADLKSRLAAIYAGRPGAEDADRALTIVVHRYGIPIGLLEALLDGFLWDSQGRRYENLADVEAYGARVAGTVGAMMSIIMGASTDTAIARASELGVAMQLTNIARDVGTDARMGRLYIPRAWFREIGMDADAWPILCSILASLVSHSACCCALMHCTAAVNLVWQNCHGTVVPPFKLRVWSMLKSVNN